MRSIDAICDSYDRSWEKFIRKQMTENNLTAKEAMDLWYGVKK